MQVTKSPLGGGRDKTISGDRLVTWSLTMLECPKSNCEKKKKHFLRVKLQVALNLLPLLSAGHDKPVSSVSWSLNRQWWLSASEDRSLRIWSHGSSEPAIVLVNDPVQCLAPSWPLDLWKQWEAVLTHSGCAPNGSPSCTLNSEAEHQPEWPHAANMSFL